MSLMIDREPELRTYRKRVLGYDRVVAMLLTLIIMTGAAVFFLFILWLGNQLFPSRKPIQAMEVLTIATGEEEGMAGDSPELGENALPNTNEAPLGDDSLNFEDSEVVDVLSSVLDAVSNQEVDLSDPSQVSGTRGGGKSGQAGGLGKRGTGSGAGGVPNYARWDIRYPSQNASEYAQALDFFKIELGVVRGKDVTFYSQLARGTPVARKGSAADERLFFIWQDAGRAKADADLLRGKGIAVAGATIAHFISPEFEREMATLEARSSKGPTKNIRKTRFGVRKTGGDYELFVIEQTYMN